MSDKPKFEFAEAYAVACELTEHLASACQPWRCTIAGSIRRRKQLVSDIEILFVPRFVTQPTPGALFGDEQVNLAEDMILHLLANGVIDKRLNTDGHINWGKQNKLAVHVQSGIPVDFFATTEPNWWVSLVIRTGSKETNLALTTSARERGRTLLAYGDGVKDLRTGEITVASSERDVFDLCGVKWLEPMDR